MNEQDIKKILPEWTLSYILNEKRGEKLYQAEKTSGDVTKFSAIRTINIPADKKEFEELKSRFADEDDLKKEIASMMKRKKEELQFLRGFCSKPGIVSMREIYDISDSDEMNYMLIARYDYIETLDRYVKSNGLTVGAALRMGIDVCKGLEQVRKLNLVHTNVRPENIYVNDNGRFKLGGFDLDLLEDKKKVSDLKIEDMRYSAPEVCKGERKVFASDVYSLGMVLFGLLNAGNLPFEDEYSKEEALKMRLSGKELPRPKYNAGKLTDIVMKACSYDTKDRYVTPYYMRKALEEAFVELQQAVIENKADLITQNSSPMMTFSDNRKPEKPEEIFDEKTFDEMAEKKRKEKQVGRKGTLLALCAMFAALLMCVATYFALGRSISDYGIHFEEGYDYTYTGELKTPKVELKTLEEGKQYEVSYSNNKSIGTAKVTVKGLGRFSGTKTATFEILPDKCKSFDVAEVTDTTVTLEWEKADHAHRYYIYVYNDQTGEWDRIKSVDQPKESYKVEGLEPDTQYSFRIRTVFETSSGDIYKSKSLELTTKTAKAEDTQ